MSTQERIVKSNPCDPSINMSIIKTAVLATVKGGVKCSDDRQLDLVDYINSLKENYDNTIKK